MTKELYPQLKGLFIYLGGIGLLLSGFVLFLKDIFSELNENNLALYADLFFWSLLIYSTLCLLFFLVCTVYLIGSSKPDVYEGVVLGFIFTILYVCYFVSLYHRIFISRSLNPF